MPRRPPPDNRLDWRDPEMPVWRNYKMRDGSTKGWVDPDYERRFREHRMEVSQVMQDVPDWRSDPTYNLRRK